MAAALSGVEHGANVLVLEKQPDLGGTTGIANQPDKICYILLDRHLVDRYGKWPHFVSTAPEIAYAYVDDYLKIRPDVSLQASTLDKPAEARNLPTDCLHRTVEEFNQYVAGEEPDALGRTGDRNPLGGNRWVLLGPAKAYFTTAEGGVAINRQMQVLDESGQPIPGLYAVEAWVKPDSIGSNMSMVSKAAQASTLGGWDFWCDTSGKLGFRLFDGVAPSPTAMGETSMEADEWYHVVGTWNSSNTDPDAIKVYVNGILDGESTSMNSWIDNNFAV